MSVCIFTYLYYYRLESHPWIRPTHILVYLIKLKNFLGNTRQVIHRESVTVWCDQCYGVVLLREICFRAVLSQWSCSCFILSIPVLFLTTALYQYILICPWLQFQLFVCLFLQVFVFVIFPVYGLFNTLIYDYYYYSCFCF